MRMYFFDYLDYRCGYYFATKVKIGLLGNVLFMVM